MSKYWFKFIINITFILFQSMTYKGHVAGTSEVVRIYNFILLKTFFPSKKY